MLLAGLIGWNVYKNGVCRSALLSWVGVCKYAVDKNYNPWSELVAGAPHYLDVVVFNASVANGSVSSSPFTSEELTDLFLETFQKTFKEMHSSQEVVFLKAQDTYSYKNNPFLTQMFLTFERDMNGSGWILKFSRKRSALAVERSKIHPEMLSLKLSSNISMLVDASKDDTLLRALKSCKVVDQSKNALDTVDVYEKSLFFYYNLMYAGFNPKNAHQSKPYSSETHLVNDNKHTEILIGWDVRARQLYYGRSIPNLARDIDLKEWVREWIDAEAKKFMAVTQPESRLTAQWTEVLRQTCGDEW